MTNRHLLWALASLAIFVGRGGAGRADDLPRPPDLGQAVQGDYAGVETTDSKSAGAAVSIHIERTTKIFVRITSSDQTVPPVGVWLTGSDGKIVNQPGRIVFVYDPAATPPHLDLKYENGFAWSGERRR